MKGVLILLLLTVPPSVFSQNIIINEIHADPDPTEGDANGDGVISSNDDEFVELVNNSGSSLDISNWTISDAGGVKHTFDEGTMLPADETIVVFGGGTPTGIPGLVQITSSLSLNNSGDDVIIKNASDIIITQYTYGSEGGDNQSLARDPDKTGSFVKHLDITGNSVRYSPGRSNSDNSPLPVELINFNAEEDKGNILLKWETATEVNNYGFEIERFCPPLFLGHPVSKDELQGWVKIGFLLGYGNSNSNKFYSYVDSNPSNGENFYRLKQIDFNGEYKYSDSVNIYLNATDFDLNQNYPNPFNPVTRISFTVPASLRKVNNITGKSAESYVNLKVFDSLGRQVSVLIKDQKISGYHEINFNAANLSSGIYFYILSFGSIKLARKMLLLK